MKVPNVILLGHTHCGAIEALAQKIDDPEIATFIDVAQSGMEKAKKRVPKREKHALLRAAEQEILLQSAENLKTYPSVAKALEEERLTIKLWIFDLEAGALQEFNPATGTFDYITDPLPAAG